MEPGLVLLSVYLPIIIILFVIGYIVPFLNSETIVFGVRIPVEEINNPLIDQLKKNYKHTYLAVMVPYFIVLAFSMHSFYNNSIITLGLVLQILLTGYIYALFNHKIMLIKSSLAAENDETKEQVVVVDTKFREGKYLVSFAWFIPSLAVIISCVFIIALNYDKIPAEIPERFNFAGQAIQFVSKTSFHVYLMPFISLINLLLLAGVYYVIKRAKQQVSSNYPEKAKLQDRRFRYLWSGYLVILAFILSIYFAVISLQADRFIILSNELFTIINIVVPNVVLIGAIVLAVKAGQSGSRLKIKTAEAGIKINIADDSVYWKLGMFYYNPEDPAIMVPKRMGIGWTLNFGHPVSFIILIALIAMPYIIKIFSR